MSRESIARFTARIKDPDLKKSVQNFVAYRRGKKIPPEEIWQQVLSEYGEAVGEETSACDQVVGLSSEEGCAAAEELAPACAGSLALSVNPPPVPADTWSGDCGILNSVPGSLARQPDVLNSDSESERYVEKVPSPDEIAAVIAEMERLQVSRLNQIGEGVVIEMPPPKPRTESPAEFSKPREPASGKDSDEHLPNHVLNSDGPILNSVRQTEDGEPGPAEFRGGGGTADADPMRLAHPPSLTRAIFSTLALMTLISFMSYYLISATSPLYGTGVAVLLVLIPVAVVLFIHVPIVRYLTLALFLGADLWSVKALHEKDVAAIVETTFESNPEYQRLKLQYAKLEEERDGINPVTHHTSRTKKALEAKDVSDKMAEIERASRSGERATADRSRADVTLGVRALLLIAAAIFAHALLHYSGALDYDAFMRRAFGRR